MTVHFIGAGPGAPDLLTLRGRDTDRRLPGLPLRRLAGAARRSWRIARRVRGSSTPRRSTLDEIMAEIGAAHAAGQDVARLHSGDLSVWSAMGEQIRRLRRAWASPMT